MYQLKEWASVDKWWHILKVQVHAVCNSFVSSDESFTNMLADDLKSLVAQCLSTYI